MPLCVCHEYLQIAHWQLLGWSVVSLHSGICLWKDVCCVEYISLAISWDLVRMSPLEFWMQSRELSIVGWNIFLCIILGFMLSNALYLVMTFLQLITVFLGIILCASSFTFRLMLAIFSIYCVYSVGFVGNVGISKLVNNVKDVMSGWFWRCVWGCWHAARMALRAPWYILIWCFHIFCCFLGRNPPWILALVVSGGVGVDMHVFSMHRLRKFMMFGSLFVRPPIVFVWVGLVVVFWWGLISLGFVPLERWFEDFGGLWGVWGIWCGGCMYYMLIGPFDMVEDGRSSWDGHLWLVLPWVVKGEGIGWGYIGFVLWMLVGGLLTSF